MKKVFVIISLVMFIAIAFAACEHTPPAPVAPATGGGTGTPPGNPTPPGTGTSAVCFESEVLPIFISNCAKSNCHDAASHQEGYVLDSYNNIIREGIRPGRATNSEIYEVLFETGNDKMPPAGNPDLTSAQKAIIGRWINEGARNTTNCGSVCDPNQFLYGAHISQIITTYCVGCHSGTAPSGGINLSSYFPVRTVALSGRLLNAVSHAPGYSPMPKGGAKLSDCQITQIRNWVNAGALNN